MNPLKFACFLALLLIAGCSRSQADVPDELKPYVTQPPINPFSLRPKSSQFAANLATFPNLPTAKQQNQLIEKLIAFGGISQLVVVNHGESIENLVKFKNLEGLHLSFSQGASSKSVDLRPLAKLKHLKELSVGYEAAVQLTGAEIAIPPGLVHLSLQQLPVSSIPGLENCKDLQELDISFNPKLKDVQALRNLPPLKRLKIDAPTLVLLGENNIALNAELTELTRTISLSKTKVDSKEVVIWGTPQLKSLDGIENWKGVAKLTFNYLASLEDISALAKSNIAQEIVFVQCNLGGKPITVDDLKSIGQTMPNCRLLVQ